MSQTAVQRARRTIRDRAKALQQDEILREAQRIEQDERRAAAREESSERVNRMREAEESLRAASPCTIVIVYDRVVVTAYPERSRDPLQRQRASHALSEAMHAFQADFERRVGAARASAVGKDAPAPVESTERLMARLRDLCRHALGAGTVIISEVRP